MALDGTFNVKLFTLPPSGPVLEVGGVQMLSDISRVDLFPNGDRAGGVDRLIQALRTACP